MSSVRSVLLAGLSMMAFACASEPPATATLTAADVAKIKQQQSDEKIAAKEAPPAEVPEEAGKLVCHASRSDVGTVELYLKWENGSAKGVLRTTAPSGNLTSTRVGADSHNGLIVVDDLLSGDLVEHAALVKNLDGKRLLRLNGSGTWLTCTYAS